MTLSDLKRFIRIEDETRTRTKTELLAKQNVSANMMSANSEKDNYSSFKKKKSLNRKKNQNSKNLNVQKKEFKKSGKCFNCKKQRHFAKDCKAPKKETTHNVNQVDYDFDLSGNNS